MPASRVLITGGAGFIGCRLALRLQKLGSNVAIYDNFNPQSHEGNGDADSALSVAGVAVIRGDIRDLSSLQAAIARCDPQIVYHLAAETATGQSFFLPSRYAEVNVTGTAHLIEAIRSAGRSVRRVVLASSRSVYGEGACVDSQGQPALAAERLAADLLRGDYAPKDARGQSLTPVKSNADCPVAPASIYASSKLMQEYLLKQGFWGTDVQVGILRLQNVFGPGQSLNNPYTGVLSIFCRHIQEGRTLEIFEDGQIVRDFLLVDDAISAFVAMTEVTKMPTDILDIGSGIGVNIADVARRLLVLLGADPGRVKVTGAFRAGDIRHAVADIARAEAQLGWRPGFDLDTGLAQLADWSRDMQRAVA